MKRDPHTPSVDISRRCFLGQAGTGALLLGLGGLTLSEHAFATAPHSAGATTDSPVSPAAQAALVVAADPTRLPSPIQRKHSVHHDITLEAREVRGHLADGSVFDFMTWNGQVPGPMIRVRQGDTITLTVRSAASNTRPHSVDMHAVFGTGGGSSATLMPPGGSRREFFKCMYPGAFIYHCAVPNMDEHISRGMFGMIVVEPEDGLPPVDREFYLGQHELYTKEPFGSTGLLQFDYSSMEHEDPNFVLFNGTVGAFTGASALKAKVGETIRVFMVSGGPNLTSSFHPIGNVWKNCWPQGALANAPLHYVQTQSVPPGSCFVGEMELPVPETIKLVDHALTRVARKGLLAEIAVEGQANPGAYRAIS
ncbi:MAG: nitrite reductase, copper-containing [Pusillimonas sp.]|uniref:copper-containing nitrite reductase n=1 Tax=Rhodanobacter sp. FW021-MT20 TaxID=1162282 RepID=UPI0009D96BC9|nr:copper-containing nitrite reductase [Rhodanobacter sp. 115]TAM07556.1 MAG: nitrite reductase, copper-containing [Pusillimonas sp.]